MSKNNDKFSDIPDHVFKLPIFQKALNDSKAVWMAGTVEKDIALSFLYYETTVLKFEGMTRSKFIAHAILEKLKRDTSPSDWPESINPHSIFTDGSDSDKKISELDETRKLLDEISTLLVEQSQKIAELTDRLSD